MQLIVTIVNQNLLYALNEDNNSSRFIPDMYYTVN